MSALLRKYNTATHVYIPMVKRGVVDFAVSADWTPSAGDVKVSIDGAAAANIGTLPSAITMGNGAYWDFTIASGEVTGKKIAVTIADSATKAVEDNMFLIETYGHASAEYQADLSAAALPVNVTQFGGSNGTFASGRPEVNTTHVGGTSQTAGDLYDKIKPYDTGTATAADDTSITLKIETAVPLPGTQVKITSGSFATFMSNYKTYVAGTRKLTLDPPPTGLTGTPTYELYSVAGAPTTDPIDMDISSGSQAAFITALTADSGFMAAIVNALFDGEVEASSTTSFVEALRLILSAAAAPTEGFGTTNPKLFSLDGSITRMDGTADAVGNRSAITYDKS